MFAAKETTVWNVDYKQPNHTYLFDGDKAIAYITYGSGKPVYFRTPMRMNKKRRTFEILKINPFKEKKISSTIIRVIGSKGSIYEVDTAARTCSCEGFKWRGKCKHVEAL